MKKVGGKKLQISSTYLDSVVGGSNPTINHEFIAQLAPLWERKFKQAADALGIPSSPDDQRVTKALEAATWERVSSGNQLVIISGPGAVGKSTIQKQLERDNIPRCPFVTTRPLRANERQGIDIVSLSFEEFHAAEARGDFLFVSPIHKGSIQAVPRQQFEDLVENGRPFVMERCPRSLPDLVKLAIFQQFKWIAVYLIPHKAVDLVHRLIERHEESDIRDSQENLEERCRWTYEAFPITLEGTPYTAYLCNDRLEETFAKIRAMY